MDHRTPHGADIRIDSVKAGLFDTPLYKWSFTLDGEVFEDGKTYCRAADALGAGEHELRKAVGYDRNINRAKREAKRETPLLDFLEENGHQPIEVGHKEMF